MTGEENSIQAWANRTGLNAMCYQCPLLCKKCIGSKNKTWTVCHRRKSVEYEAERQKEKGWVR